MMNVSEQGIRLIKGFEGLRLKAYRDCAGVWTIGYGSTKHADGTPIQPGEVLPGEPAALALFIQTLSLYTNAVNAGVKVPLYQDQFDALVSLTYNVGVGIMRSSTLLRKLNLKDYAGAADQFLVWNKITDPITHTKKVSNTLLKRREQERALFLRPSANDDEKG